MSKSVYLHYNIIFLTISGLYKIETDSTIKKFLYNIWRCTVYMTVSLAILANAIDLWTKGMDDFELVVKNYIYFGGSFCVLSRLTYWFIYNEAFVEVIKELDDIFKYKTDTGLTEKDIRNHVVLTKMITLFWILYSTVAAEGFVLLPLIFQKNSRSLSLPMWLPFNWKISPWYEGVLLVQIFFQQLLVMVVTAPDTSFASTLILTNAQFQLLGWECKHMVYKTLLKNGVDLDTVLAFKLQHSDIESSPSRIQNDLDETQLTFIRNVLSSKKLKSDLLKNLNDLIQFHQSLLNFCKRLNGFYSPAHLVYFMIVIAAMVFVEYNIIQIRDVTDVTIVATSCMYLMAALFSMFIPCFFSNLLTSEAEKFIYELYDTPWFICDEDFKTNFKMLHQRSCKPIIFTIGKFGYLTLSTFLAIVKASINYVAVLRQVTSDS